MKNNALMVETDGNIQCIPGYTVALKIDREYDTSDIDDPDQLEDQMNRYLSYEGTWYVARVRSYVRPNKNSYRQVLTLVRNFSLNDNIVDPPESDDESFDDLDFDKPPLESSSVRKRPGAL